MKSHRLDSVIQCPACGADLTAAYPVDDDTDEGPQDGDASLCVDCRALLVYSGSPVVSLRYPTPEEERDAAVTAQWTQIRTFWSQIRAAIGDAP